MICLMFLTIMCLATQKNILCKLLKLYHPQQQQQGRVGERERGTRQRGVCGLASNKPRLGPASLDSFGRLLRLLLLRWRLLSPPLCHRLCLLSNVNGVAPHFYPLPVIALLFCPHASNFLAVINLGLLCPTSFLTRLLPKSSSAYLCAASLPPCCSFSFPGFLLRE